jgi:hypothetical protein
MMRGIPEEFTPGHIYTLFSSNIFVQPVRVFILRVLSPVDDNGLAVVDVLREHGGIEHRARLSICLWRLVV